MKIFSKKIYIGLLFMLFAVAAFAQDRVVSGAVNDDSGNPLPGVNVLVKGTSTGTATDVTKNRIHTRA